MYITLCASLEIINFLLAFFFSISFCVCVLPRSSLSLSGRPLNFRIDSTVRAGLLYTRQRVYICESPDRWRGLASASKSFGNVVCTQRRTVVYIYALWAILLRSPASIVYVTREAFAESMRGFYMLILWVDYEYLNFSYIIAVRRMWNFNRT